MSEVLNPEPFQQELKGIQGSHPLKSFYIKPPFVLKINGCDICKYAGNQGPSTSPGVFSTLQDQGLCMKPSKSPQVAIFHHKEMAFLFLWQLQQQEALGFVTPENSIFCC